MELRSGAGVEEEERVAAEERGVGFALRTLCGVGLKSKKRNGLLNVVVSKAVFELELRSGARVGEEERVAAEERGVNSALLSLCRVDATTDWKEYTSPDGRKYYFNSVTNKSKWFIPDELKLARERTENASCIETQAGAASSYSIPPPPNPPPATSSEFKIPTNMKASDSKVSASLSSPSLVSPVNTAQPVPAARAIP
ncbi:hypothetical protein Droror1_Dr00014743 [Drosera rotundifolia]